jgi:Mn2+/Fe2+ NRAMP family transporter
VTGMGFVWWIAPLGILVWIVLWSCGFGLIEYGLGLLGLVTLAFVVSAWQLGPEPSDLAASLIPTLPSHDLTRYGFLAVSIVGATVSPYLLNFYASGTVEEHMTESELWVNRTTSYLGMCFGGAVSMGVLISAAMVLGPLGIRVDSYEQAALMFVPAFGQWAVLLFAMALGVGCLGASVEIVLNAGYTFAQVFGWSWGANRPRHEAARFTAAFTLVLGLSMMLALTGVDPLRVTLISAALTVIVMPMAILPFIVLMNDPKYVKAHTNGPIANSLLAALTILAGLLALVVVPLEVLGG